MKQNDASHALLSNAQELGHEARAGKGDHAVLKLWLRMLASTTQIEAEIRKRLREHFDISLARFDYMAQLFRYREGLKMRVLSRYLDGIMIRTYDHADVEELARFASIPVINGLTDLLHPCQVLADLLTIRESLGGWEGKTVAWIGDGNNMANSWLNAAGVLGFELRLACPEGYQPNREILERNRKLTRITLTTDPREAARGAHVVNTDVWASMGQEEEQEVRVRAFQGYIVDEALMATADRNSRGLARARLSA